MIRAVADTHAIIWYVFGDPRLSVSDLIRLVESGRSVWVEIPFDRSIAHTMQRVSRAEIPELADRMIAATALHLGVPVITRDHKIEASNIATIW